MSKLQICDLNSNSLNEINERESKQVVGGLFDVTLIGQTNNQLALNLASVGPFVGGVGIGQNAQNFSGQFAIGVS